MHATPGHFIAVPHGTERRAKPRRAPKSLAYVNVGDANGGVIVDISETGMSIASAEPFEPNARPRLRFQLPHIDRTFEVLAEMVWSADSTTKAGVRFVSMPIDDRMQIRNWIKDELFAEAFPTRVANTMVPRRRLPFNFDTMAEAAASAAREPKPHVPAKTLPDIPVTIPSHTMAAFEKMFPSESTLGPQIVKRAERAQVAPSQPDIDTAALWMNFPSERDVAPRVVESDETAKVIADVAPSPVVEDLPSVSVPPESVSESASLAKVATPEIPAHAVAAPEERACEPVVEQAAEARVIEETAAQPLVEVVYGSPAGETTVANSAGDTVQSSPEAGMPETVEASAPAETSASTANEAAQVPLPDAEVAAETAAPALAEATAAASKIFQAPITPLLSISEFEVARTPIEAQVDESSDLPIHELDPVPEGPAFAASQMACTVDISQAIRTPGKFSGGAVSDASVESLLAIAEAEEASPPLPPKPIRVAKEHRPTQARVATPVRPAAKTIPAAAATAPLPHVALRSAAQQAAAPRNLADGDKQFHGLLIAAAVVFLALCFVIGYSHNVQLPWMNKANKSSNSAPASVAPAQPAPSAAPASDPAPSPSSQVTPDSTSFTTQASSNVPATNDSAQSRLPDSASIAPSAKFEAPPLPATPTPPPSSYFPVTAPAEGSAPRMVELPETTVFDSPKVLIQLRKYFFVPPQPGPEWSHKLDQILVGESTLKMPPSPASNADSSVVHVRATFGKDGTVKNVRPIDGPVTLLPRSVDAVRQWRYQPSVLDGQPVEWQGDFTIEFRPAS